MQFVVDVLIRFAMAPTKASLTLQDTLHELSFKTSEFYGDGLHGNEEGVMEVLSLVSQPKPEISRKYYFSRIFWKLLAPIFLGLAWDQGRQHQQPKSTKSRQKQSLYFERRSRNRKFR